MTEGLIQPKVCAVCAQVCDRFRTPLGPVEWVHTQEVVGRPDHVCIPVDYKAIEVVCRCDFCYRVVTLNERWIVPANDFPVKIEGTTISNSAGGWACDTECAAIASRRDWPAMIQRHLEAPETRTLDTPIYQTFLVILYDALEANMTEDPRPFRAGDEMISAVPG